MSRSSVAAAGAVPTKRTATNELLVCLVHRPLYDDWTLPKGKLEHGESHLDAALREVAEEAGLTGRILGDQTRQTSYVDHRGRAKIVTYFLMAVENEDFVPNEEVDRCEWLSPSDAVRRLTYGHDAQIIVSLLEQAAE